MKSHAIQYLLLCSLISILLGACNAPSTSTIQATNTPPPISIPTATPVPTSITPIETTAEPTNIVTLPETKKPIHIEDWQVFAQKLSLPAGYEISDAKWDEEAIHLIGKGNDPDIFFSSFNFQQITPSPEPSPTAFDDKLSEKTENGYRIRCVESGIELLSEEAIVATSPIKASFCDEGQTWVSWTDTGGGAFAFLDTNGNIYIWEIANLELNLVGQTDVIISSPRWNRSGTQVFVLHSYAENSVASSYILAYRDGQDQKFFPVEMSMRSDGHPFPSWFADNLIFNISQCAGGCTRYSFYEADTGDLLVSYIEEHFVHTPFENFEIAYPWILFHNNYSGYELYNFSTKTNYNIAEWPEYQFKIIGWDDNNQAFLLVREPADIWEELTYSPDITYGYLRYYPETRVFEWLLRDALYVDRQGDAFFAITINSDGQGMAAGLYDAKGQKITYGNPFSDHLILKENIADADWFDYPNPFSSAWSNIGEFFIYADYFGSIHLLDTEGYQQEIARGLAITDRPFELKFIWSPDDTQVLVIVNGEAWVVTP